MEESLVEPSDDFGGFPEQVREDVDGLIWLGYLEDSFDFCGHDFVIRTLRGDEELNAGLVCKEYTDQIGQDRAYVWATISLALVSVDGDENFCPPTTRDKKDYARARFNYCTSKWFWELGLAIFRHYSNLQVRQADAMKAVEDLSSGSRGISSPSPDSLIDRATSPPGPIEDIRDLLDD